MNLSPDVLTFGSSSNLGGRQQCTRSVAALGRCLRFRGAWSWQSRATLGSDPGGGVRRPESWSAPRCRPASHGWRVRNGRGIGGGHEPRSRVVYIDEVDPLSWTL